MSKELLALLVPVLAYIGVYLRKWILTHLTPKQLDTVFAIARSSVSAAEEAGRSGGLNGSAKYGIAADALVAGAKRVGIKLKPVEVTSFVNAAVDELHQVQAYTASASDTAAA